MSNKMQHADRNGQLFCSKAEACNYFKTKPLHTYVVYAVDDYDKPLYNNNHNKGSTASAIIRKKNLIITLLFAFRFPRGNTDIHIL